MSLLWEKTACSVGTELLQGQQTKQNKRKKYHIFKLVEHFEIILRWLYNENSFLTIWASKKLMGKQKSHCIFCVCETKMIF